MGITDCEGNLFAVFFDCLLHHLSFLCRHFSGAIILLSLDPIDTKKLLSEKRWKMILLYGLFALTLSMVLTALLSRKTPQHRQGHIFIIIFVVLSVIAGAGDVWLVPVVASGQRSLVYPAVLLAVFCAVLMASVLLSVRSTLPMTQAAAHRDAGLDAESTVFGSFIWLATLIFGIAVLRVATM